MEKILLFLLAALLVPWGIQKNIIYLQNSSEDSLIMTPEGGEVHVPSVERYRL